MKTNLLRLFTLAAMFASSAAWAAEVQVAVAANFSAPMQLIAEAFHKDTGNDARLVYGATGKFYAQIKNGAPFEVLLAADSATPERLAQEGDAIAASRFTYAIGKLVLWSPRPGLVDERGDVLRDPAIHHVSYCNPALAPYGAAAVAAMKSLGVYEALQPKLVQGESVTQAYQFVASGNAEIGFVALSQVQRGGTIAGSAWILPADRYPPIRQDAVMLVKGQHNPAADDLMRYLKSPAAREIIRSFGYELP